MQIPSFTQIVCILPSLLIGYTVHELGHALTAYFLGDYSQVEEGKITLNPFEHISWIGSLAFIFFGIGWPKPVRANPQNFKRQHLDMALVAVSGPVASLTLALIGLLVTLSGAASLVYLSGVTTDRVFAFLFPLAGELPQTVNLQVWAVAFTSYIVTTSFWLTFISLLPLPGLDGFAALVHLLAFFRQGQRSADSVPMVADKPLTLLKQRKRRNNAADIHFKIGTEYHEEHQYEDAIARYRQALRNDQQFGPAYVNMGLAYLAKGERNKAIQAFRGATQYGDDPKSQGVAWRQLYDLSDITPINEEAAQESMAEMGTDPWTDTRPRPNWFGLGIGSGLILLSAIILYSHLLTQLIGWLDKN